MKKRAGEGGRVVGMGRLCWTLLNQPQIRVAKSEWGFRSLDTAIGDFSIS